VGEARGADGLGDGAVGDGLALVSQVMGEGPHLVVLHGLFGAGQNWHTIARQHLMGAFTLHLLDLRNHGQSPHASAHDYPSMAADVRRYIAAHVPEGRAHVLGHSMGGKVAMQVALTTPAYVERLVVLDMAPRAYAATHLGLIAAMQAADLSAARSRKDVEDMLLEAVPDRSVRLFLLTNLVRGEEGLRWRVNLAAIARHYAAVIGEVRGEAPFEGRAWFIRGAESDFVRDADWPAAQALFPRAALVTIPGAGHWVHADAPEALAGALKAALLDAGA
jgi:pimeloyl-ACP methyl ester carboxylesterase